MEASSARAWDYLPVVPAVASGAVLGEYISIMQHQGDEPTLWFVVGLAAAAAASLYGAWRQAPLRGFVLAVVGTVLVVYGVLALFSVGLPLVVAGGIAFVAATRVDH